MKLIKNQKRKSKLNKKNLFKVQSDKDSQSSKVRNEENDQKATKNKNDSVQNPVIKTSASDQEDIVVFFYQQ